MKFNELEQKLKKTAPNSYKTELKILIEEYTELDYFSLSMDKETDIENQDIISAIEKREQGIPLQYIIGKWDFYRQTYEVNENCLIPRQDTECLVELAIELLPKGTKFLDLCTGSGCIAISTLCEREDVTGVMVDKFPKTLELAVKNSELNGVAQRAKPVLLDLLSEDADFESREFDAILSNPPYIRSDVVLTLAPEVRKEPHAALDGGEDGLVFYRKICTDYKKYLKDDGFILFEIGYDQAEDIKQIANENQMNCDIFKDYSGNDRIAKLTFFDVGVNISKK